MKAAVWPPRQFSPDIESGDTVIENQRKSLLYYICITRNVLQLCM